MIHLGDICKINGAEITAVDVITGGSPCQDLSVAGKRAGLDGERSGLFMEQIRIVKEMRENDIRHGRTAELVRPRYMVWENVPGAFSSNGGKDFQAVLTEIVRIVEQECPDVPLPEKGKWPKYGAICDEMGGWSVAWRTHDAQYWGVLQRRRRICVVADFNGATAADVLFDPQLRRETENQESDKAIRNSGRKPRRKIQVERKSLFGNTEPCGETREGATAAVRGSIEGAISFQERAGKPGGGNGILIQHEHVGALSTLNNQSILYPNDQGGSVIGCSEDIGPTLRAQDHGHAPAVIDVCAGFKAGQSMAGGIGWEKEKAATLSANCSGTEPTVFDGRSNANKIKAYGIDHVITTGGNCTAEGPCIYTEIEATLKAAGVHSVYDARGNGDGFTVPTITGDHENRITDYTAIVAGYKSFGDYEITETGKSLLESDDVTTGDLIINNRKNIGIVRRITPLECTRLQGYPDGWCDIGEWVDSKGKKHADADSPKYKALGNSIAIPFWSWLARRIAAQYEQPVTLGSLFDGIGGFPLAFERAGGKAIWASEIEEYPIAVTKRRFPE